MDFSYFCSERNYWISIQSFQNKDDREQDDFEKTELLKLPVLM